MAGIGNKEGQGPASAAHTTTQSFDASFEAEGGPFDAINTRRIVDATLACNPSLICSHAISVTLDTASSRFYSESMPFVLATLILASPKQLLVLSQSTVAHLRSPSGSSLVLPKHTLVRKFFVTSDEINLPDRSVVDWIDSRGLSKVLQKSSVLGFTTFSIDLLDNALKLHNFDVDPYMQSWNCRQAVFFGSSWRWNPLTSTQGGVIYLARLTHLTMWLEDDRSGSYSVPTWVKAIPFDKMPCLTHFAYAQDSMSSSRPTEMKVHQAQVPGAIHRWLLDPSRSPQEFGLEVSSRLVTLEDVLQM
ncbi:hypothetical protein DXG01_004298 [Tephrocybe rancida]|nr:hypothetical protein DXG01_004298 [Tephrocybe rancida]